MDTPSDLRAFVPTGDFTLGKALADGGRTQGALEAYRRGIEAAQAKGDKQAEKEMKVFARRLERSLEA